MSYDLFAVNFFPIVGILFVLVFLWRNSNLEKHLKGQFFRLSFFVAAETVLYDLELILVATDCSKEIMTLVTALGYTIRPVLLYLLISIIIRDENRKRIRVPLMIPIVICAVFSFSAFFTDLGYSYDSQKVFHRGVLGWTPHVVMFVYLIVMVVLSFTYKKKSNRFERIVIIEIVVMIVAATFAESLFGSYVILRVATTASLLFYYMYFQSERYQDELITKQQLQLQMSENFSLQMVTVLASTVDAKDSYTQGHSRRVADYSREIARRMGKDEEFQKRIYYMGMLHDIGKIGIPDSIIKKSGRLTAEEYDLIRSHPRIGADVLKNISEMPTLYYGARWHHERYDGKGYPDGLSGKNIPLEARIIAVADAYDAMTSRRSYRSSLSQDQVRMEIQNGRGTQFDPTATDIMLAMINEDTQFQMRETLVPGIS